jgi:hypothetical protein
MSEVAGNEAPAAFSHGVVVERVYNAIRDIANGSSHPAFARSSTDELVSVSAKLPIEVWEVDYALTVTSNMAVEHCDFEEMQSTLKEIHPRGELIATEGLSTSKKTSGIEKKKNSRAYGLGSELRPALSFLARNTTSLNSRNSLQRKW